MKQKTARSVALDLLNKIEEGRYSHLALQSSALSQLGKRDKEFAIRCVYGVVERKLTLDYFLSLYIKNTKKMQRNLRNILRLGLYQLQYTRTADFAIINESVELAKRTCPYASSMVNAVLRRCLREKDRLVLPKERDDLRYSCPQWLIKQLQREYGSKRTDTFLTYSLKPAPIYLRTNLLQTTDSQLLESLQKEEVQAQLHPEVAHCIKVLSGNPLDTKAFEEGQFHVQDVSSQICANTIASYQPKRVLDLCAAPGGKSFTLYQQLDERETFLACDLDPKRLALLEKGANRLHFNQMTFRQQDARNADIASYYDAVICDLPCSGFGVIRRKPEIKYKSEEQIQPLIHLQREILDKAALAVFPNGGRLIYSTCTLLPKENHKQVAWFLENHPPFTLELEKTFLPDDYGGDGFYFAILRRKGGVDR